MVQEHKGRGIIFLLRLNGHRDSDRRLLDFIPSRLSPKQLYSRHKLKTKKMALRRSILAAVFVLSCANFVTASPEALPRGLSRNLMGLLRRDLCTENGQVDCFNDCMPPDGNCCDDGSGTYCPSGEYCVPNGCCPNGDECSGGGGTVTYDDLTGTGSFPTGTAAQSTTQTFVQTPTTTFGNAATTAKASQTGLANTATSTTHVNAETSTKASTAAVVTVTQGSSSSSGAGSTSSSIAERYALLLLAFAQWALV